MNTKTPKSDALINALYDETGHVGQHNCPERWVKLCREVEETNARLTTGDKLMNNTTQSQAESTPLPPLTCSTSWHQDGYAIIETGRSHMPITLGFALTEWEAKREWQRLQETVSAKFFGNVKIISATLIFNLSNAKAQGRRELDPQPENQHD